MTVLTSIASLFSGGKDGLIKQLSDGIGQFIHTDEEKQKMTAEIARIANEHQEKMQELTIREMEVLIKEKELELADVANARSMQIEALKQDDKFAKRFVYFLSIFYLIFCFAFTLCFFYIDIPEKNRDIVNIISGVVITTGLSTIIQFFFGTSKSSEDKTKMMHKMSERQK